MKRKVVMHGNTTLTVSLPSGWTRKNRIKKGDELEVVESGKDLIITSKKSIASGSKVVDVSNYLNIGESTITSLYREGYDSVTVRYSGAEILSRIQHLLEKDAIGYEITDEDGRSITIKDISGQSSEEFDSTLRRLWRLVLSMAEESISGKDDRVGKVEFIDKRINKLSNYCIRVLIKKGHKEYSKTPVYYFMIRHLEFLGDEYKEYVRGGGQGARLKEINNFLGEAYSIFYKYDAGRHEQLFRKVKETQKKMSLSKPAYHPEESILNVLAELLPALVEINL